MKRIVFFMSLAYLFSLSCSKQEEASAAMPETQSGSLTINLDFERSKAVSPYTTALPYETQLNNLELLIFDRQSNNLEKRIADAASLSGNTVTLPCGEKNICVFVNAASHECVSNKTSSWCDPELLDANSIERCNFVMYGETDVNVTSDGTVANVLVKRITSRVALRKITCALPEAYDGVYISNVWLSNVASSYCPFDPDMETTYINRQSRVDEEPQVKSHIIDGGEFRASCPELTCFQVDMEVAPGYSYEPQTPVLLYGYKNTSTTEPYGWGDLFEPCKTMLVVETYINGERYYYPVTLNSFGINQAITVELTISSIGSDDPNDPVEKGALTANITVGGWDTAATYEETI